MKLDIRALLDSIPNTIKDQFIPVAFEVGENVIDIGTSVQFGFIFTEGALDVMHVNSKDVLYTYCQDYNANFVGLMEIYSESDHYCCTCRARKKCVGYRLSKELYLKMLEECNEFKTYLIKYWASQFYNQALNRTQYPNNKTKEKVICYIAELITKKDMSGKTIEIIVKRDDIAEYIGCSKRTIYRIFSCLQEEGYFDRKGQRLVINSTHRHKIIKKVKQEIER